MRWGGLVVVNGAIGVRVSIDGETMYLTDVTGLGIYDISNPASPQIRSHLPLPRAHEEPGTYLVDVSDPGAPVIRDRRPGPRSGLTVYDVRDLSSPPPLFRSNGQELAWITDETGTFAFDLTDPTRARLVLGGPGEPRFEHRLLLSALGHRTRSQAWSDQGAPVGFYVSGGSFWGACLAPSDCPPSGSRGRTAGRQPALSPMREWGRSASWGRGPVPSPSLGV